jgi:FKBP-type peptidyl-prolyl cis-trans isomerase FkpA
MKLSYQSAAACLGVCLVLGLGCATRQMSAPGPTVIDADAPTEFTVTSSGLKYKVLRKGSGAHPGPQDNVTVHYKGWLDSGKIFDTSYTRGEPISFRLNEVVSGWTEGLQLVSEGGMIELEIPSPLGYGVQGQPGIPPNSTLHFIVELIKVE